MSGSPGPERPGSATSVVLLEIVCGDRYRNYRSHYYPFLQPLLAERVAPTSWLCVGVEAKEARSGENLYVYDLPPRDLDRVIAALAAVEATHVLLNERLSDETARELGARLPRVAFAMSMAHDSRQLVRDAGHLVGHELLSPADGDALLEDLVRPVYHREPLGRLVTEIKPFVHLRIGPECVYTRPLADNRHYAKIDLEGCSRTRGCTFCLSPDELGRIPRLPPLELATRQVSAAEATVPAPLKTREYQVHGAALWFQVDEFFDELLRLEIPASDFHFSSRIDELLAVRQRLERCLPRLEQSGHRICLYNIGVENFSPIENERFNKGLTPAQIDAGIDLCRELERRFPRAFRFSDHGGVSLILFTPWTTIADLRANIAGMQRHDIDPGGFVLDSALQLLPELPVTRLVESAGLLADQFADHPYDSGCISEWTQHELPWRFANGAVATVYRVARRLCSGPDIPEREPLYQLVQAWLTAMTEAGATVLEVFEALVDVVEASGAERSTIAVLRRIEARLERSGPGWLEQVVEDPANGWQPDLSPVGTALPAYWQDLADRTTALFSRSPRARAMLGRYNLESITVARSDGEPRLDLTLTRPGRKLLLLVEANRPERKRYQATDQLAISYRASCHPLTDDESEILIRTLEIVDRVARREG